MSPGPPATTGAPSPLTLSVIWGALRSEILRRTEASMRAAIAAIPGGVYDFENHLDDYGPSTDPVKVPCTVTVAGDADRHEELRARKVIA